MSVAEQLRAMLPPVAYDRAGRLVMATTDAEANVLDGVIARAAAVKAAMHPRTAGDAIVDWERVYALQSRSSAPQVERVQAVLSKMGETGGLSVAYFERLATAAGYGIKILEPKPFRCGISRTGDPLYPDEIRFVWQVRINERPTGGGPATDAALARTFDDLKPAHTFCQFLES